MADLIDARGPFINGEFVAGDADVFAIENPATEKTIAEVEGSSPAQFEYAILAAREAFDSGPWPRMSVSERITAVQRFAGAMEARRGALIETNIAEAGSTRTKAEATHVGMALESPMQIVEMFRRLPEWEHNELPLSDLVLDTTTRLSIRSFQPVGVVSALTPYNAPLVTSIWKTVPALLTGCTVVLKPSPLTPLEVFALGEAAVEAGFPPGVLNIVVETGYRGAELLSSHPAVDMVTFTGSAAVGRAIAAQAAPTLKRVVLELGGKSVQLHLPDIVADSQESVVQSVLSAIASSGQGCRLQSRVLVPQEHKAQILDALASVIPTIVMGDPQDRATTMGPLITEAHRNQVARLVDEGIAAGARLVAGGPRVKVPDKGWYFPSTVLDVDDNTNPVAQREVFGPVATIQGYRNIDDAIAIANDTEYGLSNGIYTNDLATGLAVANRLDSGEVFVNDRGRLGAYAPFGGFKQSGMGRELGFEGIRSFQEIKNIVVSGVPREGPSLHRL